MGCDEGGFKTSGGLFFLFERCPMRPVRRSGVCENKNGSDCRLYARYA